MNDQTTAHTGTILHLQRLSTEDGPGIRTTVFFKGCPLCCAWCHNPESLMLKPQVQWIANRCIGCDSCLEACPNHALSRGETALLRDRDRCTACGECVRACPSGAMEMLGEEITVSELVKELVKDRAFFEKSGGGVTLSGGEPSLQPDFSLALMKALHEEGLSVALDTCGLTAPEMLEALVEQADVVLFDLKLIDEAAHKKWTGAGNARIVENLQRVERMVAASKGKKELWVRTPLIPGATALRENIHAIGSYLHEHVNGSVTRWELCAFNNLCRDKYERLDMEWHFAETQLMTKADLAQAETWARESGFDPKRAQVTGAARVEN
mgnify:CR=1 FL=1